MDIVHSQNGDHDQACPNSNANGRITSRKAIFLSFIGGHEFFSLQMWRAAMTELVATACLLFSLTTGIISCLESHESDPKFIVPIIVFTVAFIMLVVTVPLTGGHMNPIFTFIAALKSVITPVRALFYVLAQFVGSLVASLLIKHTMNLATSEKYSLGACLVNANGEGISAGKALLIEFACTFLVLYVAITVAFNKAICKELGLTMVCVIVAGVYALAVYLSIVVTGRVGYGGVGLNPVRCSAPALLLGGSLWDSHWVFWVGPFFGCIVYYMFSLALPLPSQDLVVADGERDIQELIRKTSFEEQ